MRHIRQARGLGGGIICPPLASGAKVVFFFFEIAVQLNTGSYWFLNYEWCLMLYRPCLLWTDFPV